MLLVMETSTYRSFVANCTLDHVLVKLAVQVDEGLADAAVYHRNAAGIGAGDGGVRRWQFR